jgi:hypothetical protein
VKGHWPCYLLHVCWSATGPATWGMLLGWVWALCLSFALARVCVCMIMSARLSGRVGASGPTCHPICPCRQRVVVLVAM